MADQFVAEVRLFAGNFAPRGWAFCNGQLLPISQNTALFSLLGTTYGGNGQTNFALPDFRDRVPMHFGQGPGLSSYVPGESGGSAQVTISAAQMPAHAHSIGTTSASGTTGNVSGAVSLGASAKPAYGAAQNLAPLGSEAAGGGQPHNNLQPYLGLNFIIALQGVYPPRD